MKNLILILTALALSACANNGDNKKNDAAAGGLGGAGQQENMENVTDTSGCGAGTQARGLQGKWKIDMRSSSFQNTQVLEFVDGVLTLSQICRQGGRQLKASVSVPYKDDGRNFTILKEDEREEQLNEGGHRMTCRISISKGTIPYAPFGSCLKLGSGDQELTVVPTK